MILGIFNVCVSHLCPFWENVYRIVVPIKIVEICFVLFLALELHNPLSNKWLENTFSSNVQKTIGGRGS